MARDYTGKMARHLKFVEEASAASGSVHTLTQAAVAVLNVFVTSGGALMTPLLHGNSASTGKYVWDPRANTVSFYTTEGDSGAATIQYLAEAP